MLVTLVIRLVPDALVAGTFVGEVEHVDSGDTQVVHEVGDLVGFATRAATASVASKATRRLDADDRSGA